MSDSTASMEDSLAAAFDNSFAMPEAESRPAASTSAEVAEATPAAEEAAAEEEAGGDDGPDWKPEYEANLAMWREEADVARANAEATRKAFEDADAAEAKKVADAEKAKKAADKEAKEAEERERRLASVLADEAPRPGPIHKRQATEDRTLKVKEAWELVRNKEKDADAPVSAASVAASQWEEISAPHSSIEDISAATVGSASSPSSREQSHSATSSPAAVPSSLAPVDPATVITPAAAGTPSLTLSLFTAPNNLTVARVFAALGINLFLPFINGIMLGLGEITAREGVRITRLWWKGERALFGNWRKQEGGADPATSVGLSGSAGF